MKKIISNLLIAALLIGSLLGCLSACDDGSDKTNQTDKAPSTEAVTNAKTEDDAKSETEEQSTVTESESASETETEVETEAPDTHVDFAGELKLDMNSDTLKQEVTVKSFIDGDTTHFYVPTSLMETGVVNSSDISSSSSSKTRLE